MRTDSNLCRKELTVPWSAPNSLIRSYLQPCTNTMWGDQGEAVAPIIWLYQTVDAQKEEVSFTDLLITLRSYAYHTCIMTLVPTKIQFISWYNIKTQSPIKPSHNCLIYFNGNPYTVRSHLYTRSAHRSLLYVDNHITVSSVFEHFAWSEESVCHVAGDAKM